MSAYSEYKKNIEAILEPDKSFDILKRSFTLTYAPEVTFYYIDGFTKDTSMAKIFEHMLGASSLEAVTENLPYMEFEKTRDINTLIKAVLSGQAIFIIDGSDDAFMVDTREYPSRGITEPEKDKVLRGPHDGFCETLIFNTTLIRRRVRDPKLRKEVFSIGELTQTDIVLTYIEGRAEKKLVDAVRKKLTSIKIGAMNLQQESLGELIADKRKFNPFPKIRYTERPDAAAAMLMEGSVEIICDNTPSVMILPTSIFDFLQESDDYYFPAVVGTYLRIVRLLTILTSLVLPPLWYLLIQNAEGLPEWLSFILPKESYSLPIYFQLLMGELMVDGLKLASLNTPNALSNSFSIVAGLILGDFAVQMGLFVPQIILLISFSALASFAQPSYELGYANKFMRLITLTLTALFGLWGFIAGFIVMIVLILTNKTVPGGRGYLYPLIPFNFRGLKRLFTRATLR